MGKKSKYKRLPKEYTHCQYQNCNKKIPKKRPSHTRYCCDSCKKCAWVYRRRNRKKSGEVYVEKDNLLLRMNDEVVRIEIPTIINWDE